MKPDVKAGSNTITARLRSDSLQLLNGTSLVVAGLTYPTSDGSNGQFLKTDGSGALSFATPTDTNTTYSAGTGISLSGTTFSNSGVTSIVAGSNISISGGTGAVTITGTDTNTTYSAGTGVTLSGTTFSIGQAVGTGNNVTFNRVGITESGGQLDLPSSGYIDWANGDARIIEGETENYSLSFKTYDGSNLTTALRLDGDNSAHFGAAIVEISDMYLRPGNTTRNLRFQPNDGSSTDMGLTFYSGDGTWRGQLYASSAGYGFLDANWGNWDIKKVPSGAFQVDTGSGLETVATQTWVNAQGFVTSAVSLSANNTFTGANSFSNVYTEFGNGVGSVSNTGSWHGRVNVSGTNHGRIDVNTNTDGITATMYAHDGHDGPRFGSTSNHPVDFMVNGSVKMKLDGNGKIFPGGDSARGYIGPQGTHDISLHSVKFITFDWDGNYDHEDYHGVFSTNSASTYSDSMAIKSFKGP